MARFDRLTVLNTIVRERLLPLFYQDNLGTAEEIPAGVGQWGAPALEFTHRGELGIEVVSALLQDRAQAPRQLIVGGGEVGGAEVVKLFPGETVGGADFVRAVLGPRAWCRLMPTGGVSLEADNLKAWFDSGVAAVGMGSKLIRSDWVKAGNYDAIRDGVQSALKVIAGFKR